MQLAAQAFGSEELMNLVGELDANLRGIRPDLDWYGSESFEGDGDGMGLGEATRAMRDLGRLDELAEAMNAARPDVDLDEEDTLYGHFHNPELLGVRKIIRKTHFHNLDLIPSNLRLYNLEYEIAGHMARNQNMEIIDLIAQAIDEVVDDYDVVIMDPPPALGMVSMAVLQAANSMVIPVPPSLVDFASTVSFIDMTRTTMKQLEQLAGRGRPAYNFIRLVGSRVDESKSMHREVLSMMRQVFGGSMTQSVMVTSAEIDNASSRMKTVFELEKPVTSHEVYNRCMKHLNDVCQDIEQDVLRMWASRAGGQI